MAKVKGPKKFAIHRWEYEVTITKSGNTQTFRPQIVTIGRRPEALRACEQIKENVQSQAGFEEATIVVLPKHVTKGKIDEGTLAQINGINDELRIMTLALRNACSKLAGEGSSDEDATKLMGEFALAARKELLAQQMGVDPNADPDAVDPFVAAQPAVD